MTARTERSRPASFLRSLDWLLMLNIVLINLFGLVIIYSVSVHMNSPGLFMKQLVASVIGLALMVGIMLIDYRDFRVLALPAYAAVIVLLLLVLVKGSGLEETGTKGWFLIGNISIQPSEYGKFIFSVVAAITLDRFKEKGGVVNMLIFLGACGLPIGLILLQPDFGTAVVYVVILAAIIFVYGLPYRIILAAMGIGLVSLPLLWFNVLPKVLDDYQMKRILSFLDPEAYAQDAAYQVNMAIRFIGSGQTWGRGLGMGRAAENVPAVHTDSIFAVVGEELGFVGAVVLIGLFTIFLLRLIWISRFSKDLFGSLAVIGIAAMFFFHIVENIGMNIGLLPVTGIPLPFISYGGSSTIANYLAMGVVLSISMRRPKTLFDP